METNRENEKSINYLNDDVKERNIINEVYPEQDPVDKLQYGVSLGDAKGDT